MNQLTRLKALIGIAGALGALGILSEVAPKSAAQAPSRQYIATATTTGLTVQKLANDQTVIKFHAAWIYCASAQAATLSWNGTATTATTLVTVKLPGTIIASAATAWSGSNVGTGTVGPAYNVPAGSTFVIDLSAFTMGNTGTGTNVTVKTDGTCTITFSWGEQ